MANDYDLIVRGAQVVTAGGVRRADLAVTDGVVAALADPVDAEGREELEGAGLHLFPGGVDPHVHFNEPGRTHWEGFESGTRALAAGGFTAFADMPLNSVPATTDGAAFDLKLEAARRSCLVDFALWGGLVPGNVDRLEELHDRGVVGFKAFMCASGIDEFRRADDLTLACGLARAAEIGAIVAVHAENAEIVAELERQARGEARVSPRDFVASRPAIAELEAISRALFLAGEAGCALHVVHVSTARGVRLVLEARRQGLDASCETCPHYLLFTEDDLEELGAAGKCAPPPRTSGDVDGLWALLAAGELPIVASDHSPASPGTKEGDDFFAVWGGVSGCQTTLQLLLEHGHTRRGLPLEAVAAVTSANAAQRFRLAGKGGLDVGSDADFSLVDLGETAALRAEDLHYRHRLSPFAGQTVRGRVARTVVRGRTVYRDGRFEGPPAGQLVRRAAPLTA